MSSMSKKLTRKGGFTLIELLVVISIISLLSSIVLSNLSAAREKARIAAGQQFEASVYHSNGSEAVGIWNFEESDAGIVRDSSGYGNDGTITGTGVLTRINGVIGKAIDLTPSKYIDLGSSFANSPLLPDEREPRTMCAWAKTNTVDSGFFRWVVAYGTGGTSKAMFIGQNNLNGTTLEVGGYANDILVQNFWQVGKWNHICLTYDGTKATVYGNGKMLGSALKTWPLTKSLAYIGKQVNSGAEYWNGSIDQVAIYGQALTASTVQKLYAESAPKYLAQK